MLWAASVGTASSNASRSSFELPGERQICGRPMFPMFPPIHSIFMGKPSIHALSPIAMLTARGYILWITVVVLILMQLIFNYIVVVDTPVVSMIIDGWFKKLGLIGQLFQKKVCLWQRVAGNMGQCSQPHGPFVIVFKSKSLPVVLQQIWRHSLS